MGLQDQDGQLTQGVRCCTRMGAIAGQNMRRHVFWRLQAPEHPLSAGNSGGVQSGVLAARLKHRVSERRYHRGSLRHNGTRTRAILRKRSPAGNEALKSLYDLHRNPTNWWNVIDKLYLVEIGFKSLKSRPCVYT